ncbi:MAG TPA: hypothetical protein QGH10_03190, partial [Armatimonadota bacterium]|nr:hypothetical protein [Armatimonadota bacterium]
TDADLAKRFEAALELLPAYPTSAGEEPIVVDVAGAPPIQYNISVPANPVSPCDVVTWFSPDSEKDLFARTIEQLQWNGNNAMVMMAVSRARLSMDGAQDWLRDEIVNRTRPNGTITLNRLGHGINDYGHYVEQTGCAMAICELLVQSVGDIIRIAPALDGVTDVDFADFRTQGGFLLTGSVRRGIVGELTVESTVGGELRLLTAWDATEFQRGDGPWVRLPMDVQAVFATPTKRGDVLRFRSAE